MDIFGILASLLSNTMAQTSLVYGKRVMLTSIIISQQSLANKFNIPQMLESMGPANGTNLLVPANI